MITKYGYTTVGIITVVVFIFFAAAILINNNAVKYSLFIIGTLFLLFTLYFFRDPDRTPPNEKNNQKSRT